MRKLRLVGIIIFAAYGGKALYKYLSDEGKVFVSRILLPEIHTVTPAPEEVPVQIETKTSMDEYYEAHKDDIHEIIKQSLTEEPDSMTQYFESHKNDKVIENVKNKIKEKIEIHKKKKVSKNIKHAKHVKHKKAHYHIKKIHSNDTVHDIIMKHLLG